MKKQFYTYLIEIDTLYTHLDSLTLTATEKQELILIIDSTIHHVVLDIALTHLPQHAKKDFITHVKNNNHTKAMLLLRSHVADIENTIKKEVEILKNKFKKDILKMHATTA
ncbi:hypothetical protein COU88_02780 [Candidatus Roizmanbacteria bacterium CG10_big_fil_rev_8_21_14_0_10_39_6]|uniref:Uncharacterized protein n=1 Tax=Candidatus Roizmanbacteria bacterium CG10_big_fil_rev_8_21_14_0_10_39_6 TaxID=1974853 RepID=A0A2M8KSE5_9BACT|nr:MAG: hypothetical protein COU88_02780 [Candidatus Roizmanbacteria bacterium CG10_big_fil_rev_8_21_14_0_10_39_6]